MAVRSARRFRSMSALRQRRGRRPVRHLDPRAALAGYLEALRRSEGARHVPPPPLLNAMGDAHLELGDEGSAEECYLRAAVGYAAEGLHDHAAACCRKILRRKADHVGAGLGLGRACAAKGQGAEALEILAAVAERCRRAGDVSSALAAQQEIVRIAPGDARARQRLARLHQAVGRPEEARRAYRAAWELCLRAGDPAGAEHARVRLEALEG